MKKLFYLLIVIGVLFRLIKFGQIPVSLNRDEVALGYNAFAIATEGIDEWGETYPVFFKSFGDYKLPGYIYILAPLVQAFGLNESITRLPSLLAGLSLIPLAYFLALRLNLNQLRSLFFASIIAISPWAIFYSRIAFEANLALAFFITSLLFFLSAPKAIHLVGGWIFFTAAILTYNAPLIAFPALVCIVWLRKKITFPYKLIASIGITIIAISWIIVTKPLIEQKNDITIFSDPYTQYLQTEKYSAAQNPLQRIAANKYIFYGNYVVQNFLKSYSPSFLVREGGQNPWHSLPGKGHFFYTTYVLLIVGLFNLIKSKKSFSYTVLLLVFGGLLPAILTVDAPHATRSLIAFFAFSLIAAYQKVSHVTLVLIIGLLLFETTVFGYRYFKQFPANHAPEWQVGLKEQIKAAAKSYPNQLIVIINPQDQPYIYALYYTQAKPSLVVQSKTSYGPDTSGLENIRSIGQWQFIGDIKDVPENTPIIYRLENRQYKTISNKNEK